MVLAFDDYFTGAWHEAGELDTEAVHVAEQLGYGLMAWPAKLVPALIASARGDDRRTEELNAVVDWPRPRGFGAVEWYAAHARALHLGEATTRKPTSRHARSARREYWRPTFRTRLQY